MIPRIRPSYRFAEMRAAFFPARDAVVQFERELADYFQIKHAFVFPYGRSAIYSVLATLEMRGNIVQPAYNCVVVAHATVLTGHRPVFVDCGCDNPNQNSEAMVDAVNADTTAVIPTSIFGTTFDAENLVKAIRRKNPRAFVLMDCAQAFDVRWHDQRIIRQGDAAILAFGIGKVMTTLFGGALLTQRDDIADAVTKYRNQNFRVATMAHAWLRRAYWVASWLAVTSLGVNVFDMLERSGTRLLKSLRSREQIVMPRDNQVRMTNLQAEIGRVQLQRLSSFIVRRRAISEQYACLLNDLPTVRLPEWETGSTHTIYTLRLEPLVRQHVLDAMRQRGVQCGSVLDYVVPDLDCYRARGFAGDFPNARAWAASAFNLPNHPTLTDMQVQSCAKVLREVML